MIEVQSKIQKKDSIVHANYTCINNKPAYRICTQKECPHPSLCCQDDQCICNQHHSTCTQVRLKSLMEKLYTKVADTTEIMKKVTTRFDGIIDQVSLIYQQTQKRIKRYGLRHAQIKFLEHMEQNRTHALKGKIVHDASQIAGIKYDGEFDQIQRCVDKLWNELGGIFWGMLYATKDMYEIPTKVNRLNPDSGQQFFADVVEQTKYILTSLENIKNQQKKQIKGRDWQIEQQKQKRMKEWGETRGQKAQQSKVIKKQKPIQREKVQEKVQYKLEDLGYSDEQENNDIKSVVKELPKAKQQNQKIQKPKLGPNKSLQLSQIEIKQQIQEDDQLRNLLNIPLIQKNKQQLQNNVEMNKKPSSSDKQIVQDQKKKKLINAIWPKRDQNIFIQLQPPMVSEGNDSQIKVIPQQKPKQKKPVQTQRSEVGKKSFSLFGLIQTKQQKMLKQACKYLNETLGIDMKNCKQFVLKNGYNKQGQLKSNQQILDIALTTGYFLNQ